MDLLILLIVLAFLYITVGVVTMLREKKEWNNGYCRKTGSPWTQFDTDSQGGRMYKDGLGNYVDISYGVDK